jgi:hypothetical protein
MTETLAEAPAGHSNQNQSDIGSISFGSKLGIRRA